MTSEAAWADDSRYEAPPGPLAHGEYADLGVEARRLSLIVRSYRLRAERERRHAEGWRSVDELFAAEDNRLDPDGSSRWRWADYAANAEHWRALAEAGRENQRSRGWPGQQEAG